MKTPTDKFIKILHATGGKSNVHRFAGAFSEPVPECLFEKYN